MYHCHHLFADKNLTEILNNTSVVSVVKIRRVQLD